MKLVKGPNDGPTRTTYPRALSNEQHTDVRLCVLIEQQVLALISMPPVPAGGTEIPSQTPCGPVLALDRPEGALYHLIADGPPGRNNLLASCAEMRARGFLYFAGRDTESARNAAPVRDLMGIVLAAIQLAQRPGEETTACRTPPGTAVVAATNALSQDLGFQA